MTKQQQRVAVPEGSKAKRYYKYYEQPLAPIPQDKIDVLNAGFGDNTKALRIENRADLLKPGDLDGEVGYWKLDDGTLSVANRTFMKNVTGEMLYWWFWWHALDPLRYAVWDPENHHGIKISDESRAKLLSSIPQKEKSRGVTHWVSESFNAGEKPVNIEIRFTDPKLLGYDTDSLPEKNCCFIVSANATVRVGPVKAYVVMTHMARPKDDGVDFRSRFWFGWNIVDGKPEKMTHPIFKVPAAVAKNLFGHNIHEYSNLAAILPSIYAEEKDFA